MKIGFQLLTTAGQALRAYGLLSFVFLASSLGLIAQGFGSISRTISDSTGAAIPPITVTATQTKTGSRMVVESNDSGAVFPTLPPAEYSIAAPGDRFSGISAKRNCATSKSGSICKHHTELGSQCKSKERSA